MFSLSRCKVGASVAVSDIVRAREFYENVLGLEPETDTGDNIGYRCADDSRIHVFVTPNAGTARSTVAGWGVDDIDAAVEALTAQGVEFERYSSGPIVTDDRGIASFDGGNRVAYFKDPDGNVLSIADAPRPAVPFAPTMVATRLPAQDLDRARAWYHDMLGLDPAETRPGGLLYRIGATSFVLFESSGKASGDHTQMAFDVHGIDDTVRELEQRGVVFQDVDAPGMQTIDKIAQVDGNYPSKGHDEWGAWFNDSEGNLIGIGEAVP